MTEDTHTILRDKTGPQKMMGYVISFEKKTKITSCWLDIEPKHLNLHGVLHGGIISTLLDSVSGYAASHVYDETGQTPFLSITINTQFISSANKGRVTAIATITGSGRKLNFVDAVLKDDKGTTLATSMGVFKPVG
ncbi:MAG: PaaI family thioesterase [Robiginitomaculum sp.]|nr:PaaI family thioesterase [Robiginitomaculum sp.]